MSDILIRGMEMPKDGEWYEINIFPNGEVCRTNWQGDQTLIKGVTAVQIPPHGDLIDRDVLREEVKKHATPSDAWVFSFIRTAPTIIPRSGEGE